MGRYQGVTEYCCGFDLYDRCQFYLAAIAPFDMAAASIFRKNLALCRDDQGLVRNSLSSGLLGQYDHPPLFCFCRTCLTGLTNKRLIFQKLELY